MPLRRKTYDGNFARGNNSDSEWGNTFNNPFPTYEHASAERTKRSVSGLNQDDTPFFEEGDKDRYLITYADLITLLLGLFIILYAFSQVDSEKYEEVQTAMANVFGTQTELVNYDNGNRTISNRIVPIKTLKESMQTMINENGFGDAIRLSENERGVTVSILEDILFSSGESLLNSNSKSVLDKISGVMKALPNDIRIEGHTDNVPINTRLYPSNWHLSVARATSTAFHLMETNRIRKDKVSIVGYAEYRPLFSNDTPEGRAQNRRVDIVILKK